MGLSYGHGLLVLIPLYVAVVLLGRRRQFKDEMHPKAIAELAHSIDRKAASPAYKPKLDCHALVKFHKRHQ